MANLNERIRSDDWKNEKHVPVIECPEVITRDELFDVKVTIGKAVAHPNVTEHHINYITLYFQPDNSRTVYEIGNYSFAAHGASVEGANQGPVHTHHQVTATMKAETGGVLYALAYCNIHGLWQSSKRISV